MRNASCIVLKNGKSVVGGLVALVLPLFGSSLSLYFVYEFPEYVPYLSDAPLIYSILISVTMGILLTPTTFIASLSGYLFGFTIAPLIVLSYTLSSLFGFFLGKYLDGGNFIDSIVALRKGEGFKMALEKNPYWFVVFCRISPILPFGLMNLALPSFGIKLKPFLLAGIVGMLPRTLLFLWLGSTAKTIQDALEQNEGLGITFYLIASLVLCSSVGLLWILKKAFK